MKTIIPLLGFGKCTLDGPLPKFNKTSPLMVGFSTRNRAFSIEFFQNVALLASECFNELLIVIVDLPYAWNDAAKRGMVTPDVNDLQKAKRIGDERLIMVSSVLNRFNPQLKIVVKRWADFSEIKEVIALRNEIRDASRSSIRLHSQLAEYSSLWADESVLNQAELFHGFLIQEFPVFVYLYYGLHYLTDIYPGPNFSFFQQLEQHEWTEELPLASSYVSDHRLSFLNVGSHFANV